MPCRGKVPEFRQGDCAVFGDGTELHVMSDEQPPGYVFCWWMYNGEAEEGHLLAKDISLLMPNIREERRILKAMAMQLRGYQLTSNNFPAKRWHALTAAYLDRVVWIRGKWRLAVAMRWLDIWLRENHYVES